MRDSASLLLPWDSPGKDEGVGIQIPSPGHLLDSWIELRSPALQADSLTSEPPGKPNTWRKNHTIVHEKRWREYIRN